MSSDKVRQFELEKNFQIIQSSAIEPLILQELQPSLEPLSGIFPEVHISNELEKKFSKLYLKENPTMIDFQKYVQLSETERGFADEDVMFKSLMLGEEVGELFKAIRKQENFKLDPESKVRSISEELADIFIFLCTIANRYEVDLEQAFRSKEEVNKQRTWK